MSGRKRYDKSAASIQFEMQDEHVTLAHSEPSANSSVNSAWATLGEMCDAGRPCQMAIDQEIWL
jgi:hypothetical protein